MSWHDAPTPEDTPDYATERDVRQLEIRSTQEREEKKEEDTDGTDE